MPLAPYQQAVLREAYALEPDGKFKYSLVVWSDIKKSIKSSIAGAVVLHRASTLYYGSIKIVANDAKQADSRVGFYARRAIQLNPELSAVYKVRPSGYFMENIVNRTRVEAIAVDPTGEAGGNDDLIVFSELWGAKNKASARMWTEMTLSPTKYGYSQRWVETYAGFDGESPILEQLYDSGVKQGTRLDLSYSDAAGYHDLSDLEIYANMPGRMLCLWNTRPRLTWQTSEYYAQEAAVLRPSEFDRVHRNAWSSSAQAFVPMEWWNACQVPLPAMDKYREMSVALDAGVSNDCFAIVGVSRENDGQHDYTTLRYARKWTPATNGKLSFGNPDDPNDVEYPEGEVRRLARDYNVVVFYYDPYQLHDFATRMRGDGVGYFVPFDQGGARAIADKDLYDNIRDRNFRHDGNPDLTEHIKNANSTAEEKDKLRIVKRSETLKIDLAVACSMANKGAHEYLPG